jgi:hypothetical protein
MKHSIHIKLCALLVVTTFVLVAAGAESVAFVPALGCALMMGAMVWMMVRPGGHGRH